MIKASFGITWPFGLGSRSGSLLAHTASRYKCKVTVSKDGLVVEGKSLMGLMLLAAETGSEISVIVDGEDEKKAMAAILHLFADKFYSEGWSD